MARLPAAKGRDTDDNVHRNFGVPHPEGYRRAMRLFTLAFHRRLLRHPEFRSGAYRLGLVESMSSGDGER
ncbi:hypothetical protein [Micromonospora sp. NPDC005203]|uniref:hypothetical protein n=1 Tax=Micromonospora sp. NPDC005203 TaxID=3364226 RepID=UPI0036BEE8DF